MTQLFSGKAPTPQQVAPMPDSNSPAVQEARRQAQLDIMSRSGRSSTILTQGGGRPSGDSYSGSKLGSSV